MVMIFILLYSIFSVNNLTAAKLKIDHQPLQDYTVRKNKNKKIVKPEYIIIHYTANCNQKSVINHFKKTKVSSHYIINPHGKITETIHPDNTAQHAGESSWKNNTEMNTYSIGIELINPGFTKENQEPCSSEQPELWTNQDCILLEGSPECWYPFTKQQISSLIALCKKLIQQYHIPTCNVLGHSDIAPGRKTDPGPLFPWKTLAEYGVGLWYNTINTTLEFSIQEIQFMLQAFGYGIKITNKLDQQTKQIITAFQMHFRPSNIDGIPDQETIAILYSLLNKYDKGYLDLI